MSSKAKKKAQTEYVIDSRFKPNLFSFATSELSQDAFIAWLASWADWRCKYSFPEMHELGKQFIKSLAYSVAFTDKTEVDVHRQLNKIDVLIEVNAKHLIVIEDKTYSRDHSDQLKRYRKSMEAEVKMESSRFYGHTLHFIYFKTGDEAPRNDEDMYGFHKYGRLEFLNTLKKGASIDNEILRDFTDTLQTHENNVKAFRTEPREKWSYDQWTGFFVNLCNDIDRGHADFGHIPNARGGFMAAWLPFVESDFARSMGYMYLQLDAVPTQRKYGEQITPRLTLRISSKDKAGTKKYRDEVSERLIQALSQNKHLKERGITISAKGQRLGKSMRLLTFENAVSTGISESFNCVYIETLENIHIIREIAYELHEQGTI